LVHPRWGQAERAGLRCEAAGHSVNDHPQLAKNVAGIGRWGNGEVEIGVASLEEVPYALGLIRQSLDRQLEEES
jgi:predicted transport protein